MLKFTNIFYLSMQKSLFDVIIWIGGIRVLELKKYNIHTTSMRISTRLI